MQYRHVNDYTLLIQFSQVQNVFLISRKSMLLKSRLVELVLHCSLFCSLA